jgi:hypothetical protein
MLKISLKYSKFMGKVSRALIVIGLIFLVPAIVLTIASVVFPAFLPDTYWYNTILKAFIMGFFYVIAFAFIILGIIIIKRDSE